MAMLWFFTVLVIGIDQLSKWWAESQDLATFNAGISFGWFGQVHPLLMLVVVIGVAVVMGNALVKMNSFPVWPRALILGGIISNVIDRLFAGAVRDWLPIPGLQLTNNLADYAIALGVLWLAVAIYTQKSHDKLS